MVNHNNIDLLFIGRVVSTGYTEKVKDLVSQSGLNGRIHFLGMRNDIQRWHSIMDDIILTSYGDSLSNAILQGMATGLP